MPGTRFALEVQPRIPAELARLEDLSNDLLYSWDRSVRSLFFRLDPALWESCGHNPKVFLRRVSQQRLDAAAEDRIYIEAYNRVLSTYDSYLQAGQRKSIDTYLHPKSMKVCRSTPAASAFSPAITARRPATWAFLSLPSACFTARAISPRQSMNTVIRWRTT